MDIISTIISQHTTPLLLHKYKDTLYLKTRDHHLVSRIRLPKISRRSIKRLQSRIHQLNTPQYNPCAFTTIIPALVNRFHALAPLFDYLLFQCGNWFIELPSHPFILHHPFDTSRFITLQYRNFMQKQLSIRCKTMLTHHTFPCSHVELIQFFIRIFCIEFIGWDCSHLPELQFYLHEQASLFPYNILLRKLPTHLIKYLLQF